MDQVVQGSFELLQVLGAEGGTMNLISLGRREELLARVQVSASVPGGSCANTLRGLSWLAGEDSQKPLYAGAVGDDPLGLAYENGLNALGIQTLMAYKSNPTGTSTIVVTPDHERTMFTFLGASRDLTRSDLEKDSFPETRYLYFTGYMWDTPNQREAAETQAVEARRNGVPIAFDLADPFAVDRYRDLFSAWIPGHVDVLFGNTQEIRMMLGGTAMEEQRLAEAAAELAPIVVMKIGPQGCLVSQRGKVSAFPPEPAEVVDTIGAGDFFAAGFLAGLIDGADIGACAKLANLMGAAIVSVPGCSLASLDREVILAAL
jgi:sugar/nucleoside kinase (ribokinase family)